MKATGVIRRIDDLGRIVIPKEIRKNLRIKNGENLEIYIDQNENIILKKNSQLTNQKDIIKNLTESVPKEPHQTIIITNTDKIISAIGKNKEYQNQIISTQLQALIKKRQALQNQTNIKIIEHKPEAEYSSFNPIIENGDVIGSIIITSKTKTTEIQNQIIKIISTFLSKYIEQ